MVYFGFAKNYRYDGDGTLQIQVRIPLIHGPYKQQVTKSVYTRDDDLPWVNSVLLPILPVEGDVVVVSSVNTAHNSEMIVLGLTGGNYHNGARI